MTISWLIFYSLSILLIVILFDKSIESQQLVAEILKVLVSGYLGYLVKSIEDN